MAISKTGATEITIPVGVSRGTPSTAVSRTATTKAATSTSRSVSGVTKVTQPITVITGSPVSNPVQLPAAAVATLSTTKVRRATPTAAPISSTGNASYQAPVTNDAPDKKFGDTVVGKILKVGAIAGGSVLGLGAVIGGISGAAAGTGVLAGAVGGVSKVVTTVGKTIDKVATGAVNLITGTTEAERKQVKEVKAEAKAAQGQLDQVDRLVKAGATVEEARNMAGIPAVELMEYDGKPIQTAGFDSKTLMIIAGAAAALLILPNLLKRR